MVAAAEGHRVGNHDRALRLGVPPPRFDACRIGMYVGVHRRHQHRVVRRVDDVIERLTLVGVGEDSILRLRAHRRHREDGYKRHQNLFHYLIHLLYIFKRYSQMLRLPGAR
nr:hypothetical protein [Paludibacteraceae bacterium]